MLKAISFDLDNTLIDFMSMKRKASDRAAGQMIRNNVKIKDIKNKLFKFYLKEGIEGNLTFTKFLKKHKQYSDRALAAALNAYTLTKYREMKPYGDVRETLRKLKKMKLKLAVITDAPRLKAFQRLEMMKLTGFFDTVVCYEDTGKTKETALPFRKALRKLKLGPDDVLHVGDNISRDINGAKKLGIKSCLAKYGQTKNGKGAPDFRINRITEIIRIAKELKAAGN